jgi:hypothetical protein
VDSERPDVSAREEDWAHDERVGGKGNARALGHEDRPIVTLAERGIRKARPKLVLEKPRARPNPRTVGQRDEVALRRPRARESFERVGIATHRAVASADR